MNTVVKMRMQNHISMRETGTDAGEYTSEVQMTQTSLHVSDA